MTNVPMKRTRIVEHTEWVIETPCDAKTLAISEGIIHNQMREMGVDLTPDNCYSVDVTDAGIMFSVSQERKVNDD